MKKPLLTTCAVAAVLLLTNDSYGQFTPVGNAAVANTGIDEIKFQPSSAIRSIRGLSEDYLEIYSNDIGDNGASLFLYSNTTTAPWASKGMMSFWASGDASSNNSERAFEFLYNNPTNSPAQVNLMTINKSGFVGIGMPPSTNASANERLSVRGNILLESPWPNIPEADRGIRTGNTDARLGLFGGFDEFDGAYIKLNGNSHSAEPNRPENKGSIEFVSNADISNDDNDIAFSYTTYDGNNGLDWTTHMVLRKDGKLVLGKDNIFNYYRNNVTARIPEGYLLYVEEGILTEKLKVANRTDYINWSDFVFNEEYDLMSLDNLENYIKKNKHLPDIPTADDVTKNGLDVAEMDARLLQKIEELTLYVIQLKKELEAVKADKSDKQQK